MQKQKQSGKKLKKPNLHFGQENCSKARYLEHLSNLLSSVTLKSVFYKTIYPQCELAKGTVE